MTTETVMFWLQIIVVMCLKGGSTPWQTVCLPARQLQSDLHYKGTEGEVSLLCTKIGNDEDK
jgi:hypothetical protein